MSPTSRTPRAPSELSRLANIGPTIERRLNEVSVHSRSDLEQVGPTEAFRRIKARYPHKTISVCYYLYSLQGALIGCHWDDLSDDQKADLRREAGV